MPETHDPYRNTIKRSLEEKQTQKRKKKHHEQYHEQHHDYQTSKTFLDQSIELPESVNNVVGVGMFALLPYMIGVTFIFLIIAQANIETYRKTDMNSFLLAWTIGYEVIAVTILLAIFKSALTFKRA